MDWVCIRTCQIRIGKKIHFVQQGKVVDSDKNPKEGCFTAIDEDQYVVNFSTASEEELMAAQWTFSEAKTAIKAAYGVTLTKEEGTKKSDVVKDILDARFRSIDTSIVKQN